MCTLGVTVWLQLVTTLITRVVTCLSKQLSLPSLMAPCVSLLKLQPN